jgi:long-subunit fatty acid transport protein
MGWQGTRGSFALSYLHSIDTGGGFAEALASDTVSASSGWKLSPRWDGGFEVSYVNSSPVTTQVGFVNFGYEGGNSFTLGASLNHRMNDHLSLAGGYDRLQENYPGIRFIARNPNSDRVFVTLSYQFRKSLGR